MDNKCIKGNTIAVIPFHLKSNEIDDFSSFLDQFRSLITSGNYFKPDDINANSDYYPEHIRNIWKKVDDDSIHDGFIQCYSTNSKVNNDYVFKADKGLRFNFGEIKIILNYNRLYEERSFGYFVVTYKWLGFDDIKSFSSFDCLRYHALHKEGKNKKNPKKYAFTEIKDTEENYLFLYDIFDDLLIPKDNNSEIFSWDTLSKYILFPHKRSYLIHIFHGLDKDSIGTMRSEAYKMIRVPSQDNAAELDGNFESYLDSILINKMLSHTTEFYAMSEGVLILDYRSGKFEEIENQLLNNYFPAFLMALNQRETQLMITTEFSKILPKLIYGKNEPRYDLVEIRKMDGDFVKIRFNQFFKSVSRNTEVDFFFKSLRRIFLVDDILEDNEDKIKSLKQLVDKSEKEDLEDEKERVKEEQETKEKKSERKINALLVVIAVFSVLSAVNDSYDLFSIDKDADWLMPFYGICLAAGVIIFVYFFVHHKNNKLD